MVLCSVVVLLVVVVVRVVVVGRVVIVVDLVVVVDGGGGAGARVGMKGKGLSSIRSLSTKPLKFCLFLASFCKLMTVNPKSPTSSLLDLGWFTFTCVGIAEIGIVLLSSESSSTF